MENETDTDQSANKKELDKNGNKKELDKNSNKKVTDKTANENLTDKNGYENLIAESVNRNQTDNHTNENETGQSVNESESQQIVTILMPKETILECWLCEAGHLTEKCPKIAAAPKVRDKPIPSRARLTLPDSLLIVKLEDPFKRLMVVAKANILYNTIFGPLEAPKLMDNKNHAGYKIFNEEGGSFALDCTDENKCNWMSLVKFSTNFNKNNLVAYQLNQQIYFCTVKEINPGEELLVSFSKVYRKKVDQLSGTTSEEVSDESNHQIIKIFDPSNYYSSLLKDGPKTVIYIEEDEIQNNLEETISQKLASLNNKTPSIITTVNVSKSNSIQLSGVSSTSTVQLLRDSNSQLGTPLPTTFKLPSTQVSTMQFLGGSRSVLMSGQLDGTRTSNTVKLSSSSNVKLSTTFTHAQLTGTKTINSPRPFQLMGDSSATTPIKTKQVSALNATKLSDSSHVKSTTTPNLVKIINIVTRYPPSPASDVDAIMDITGDSNDSDFSLNISEKSTSPKQIRRSSRKRKTTAAVEALLNKHRNLVPYENKQEPVCKKVEPVGQKPVSVMKKLQLVGKNLVPVVKKLEINTSVAKPKVNITSTEFEVDIIPAKYKVRGKGNAEKTIDQYKLDFAKDLVKKSGLSSLGITVESKSWTCSVCDKTYEDCIELAFHLKCHFEANWKRKNLTKKRPKPKLEGEYDEESEKDDNFDDGPIYNCDLCKKKLIGRRNAFRHLQKHTGEFYCRLCERVFACQSSINIHHCTANPKQWSCDVCNKVCLTSEGLKNHKYCYHSEPRLPCKKCGRRFHFRSRLRIHTLSCKAEGKSVESKPKTKDEKSYECKTCQKVFCDKTRYEIHMPKHTGEFACQFCGKWLASKNNLKEHIVVCMHQNVVGKKHTQVDILDENGQISCSYCNEVFTDLIIYRTHFYQHSYPFECQICGFRAKLNHELTQHVCFEREFKCKVCDLTFAAFCILKEHRIKENHHDPPLLPEKELEELKGQSFLCELCGASFMTKIKLHSHGIHHKEKKFTCKVCHKKFLRKRDFQRHEFIHRERSIPCPYCSKLFKCNNTLLVHIRLHEGIRKYCCPFCDKTFLQKGNLNKHLDTHDKNKRYYCSFCPKDFSSTDGLRDHEKIHKYGKNFKCEICRRSYLKAHQLRKHMASNHCGKGYLCKYCGVVVKLIHSLKRHLRRKHSDRESDWKNPEVVNSMLGEHSVLNTKVKRKKDDDCSDIALSSSNEDAEKSSNHSNKGGQNNRTISEDSNEEMEAEAPNTLMNLAENCTNLQHNSQTNYKEENIEYVVPKNQYQSEIFTHTDFNTGEVVIVTSVEEPHLEYEERVISSDFLVHQDGTDNLVMYVDTTTTM